MKPPLWNGAYDSGIVSCAHCALIVLHSEMFLECAPSSLSHLHFSPGKANILRILKRYINEQSGSENIETFCIDQAAPIILIATPEVVGGTLLGEDELVVTAGAGQLV